MADWGLWASQLATATRHTKARSWRGSGRERTMSLGAQDLKEAGQDQAALRDSGALETSLRRGADAMPWFSEARCGA